MDPSTDTIDDLHYEICIDDTCVSEIESGEDAWAFLGIDLRADDEQVGTFTDFLAKNVTDLRRLAESLANREECSIVKHDSGGNIIDVIEYDGDYASVSFAWAAQERSWFHVETLIETLVEILEVVTVLIEGINPAVADLVDAEEHLDAATRLL